MHGKPHYQCVFAEWLSTPLLALWALLNNVGRKGSWMSGARHQWPGRNCAPQPTSVTKLTSILGYDHWGGTPPLHYQRTLAGIPIGARQRQPWFSFTSPLSTPIFHKTIHLPQHTPNSFTFKRVKTRLTQSLSRVQTQITHSLSRVQARLAPQGFWPSCPQALASFPIPGSMVDTTYRDLPHPGFVPYPKSGLWFYITYLNHHHHEETKRPSVCSRHVRGAILQIFFLFFWVALWRTCVVSLRQ